MSNDQQFESELKKHRKDLKLEAIQRCMVCSEVSNEAPCIVNCSKYYHMYEIGSRLLMNKYMKAMEECTTSGGSLSANSSSSSSDKSSRGQPKESKCRKDAMENAMNDMESLMRFVKRVKSNDENAGSELKEAGGVN